MVRVRKIFSMAVVDQLVCVEVEDEAEIEVVEEVGVAVELERGGDATLHRRDGWTISKKEIKFSKTLSFCSDVISLK